MTNIDRAAERSHKNRPAMHRRRTTSTTPPTRPPTATKTISPRNSRKMKRTTRQTTLCVATLALTALSSASSVRGAMAAIAPADNLDDLLHHQDEEEDHHTPSVAPTTINDMFAQDLANSSDDLPELWEEEQNRSSMPLSASQQTSRANVIDLHVHVPSQEATLSAATASLGLESITGTTTTTNTGMPISTASLSLPPRLPDTIRGDSTYSAPKVPTLKTYNDTSLPNDFTGSVTAADYKLDLDHHGGGDDAPVDDVDVIMIGDAKRPNKSAHHNSEEEAAAESSSVAHWSPSAPAGTSRAQLDKSPQMEEAEARFEENRRIAAKLQTAADQAKIQDEEEQRARQLDKESALDEMKSRSSKNSGASAASLQRQHKHGLNVRLGQRAAPAQTVYVGSSGDYDTLPTAIHAGALNIILEEGTHVVDSTIVLGQHQAGISIRGVSKTNKSIIKFVGKDSAIVIFNSHNVVLSNLVIDAVDSKNLDQDEEGYDGQMWQVVGVVNSSQVGIIDCTIRSPSSMHAIFFAGAFYAPKRLYQPFFGDTLSRFKSEEETVEAYRGGYLDNQNVVRNCNIYSDYQGDAIFFAFQRNGEVSGNKITRASISIYMNRDTTVSENTLNSSPLYGIHVSLPSDNIYVESNKITGSGGSGIKVARVDLEDEKDQTIPTVTTHERPEYRATGIRINNNAVALSSTIGIEVEMTHGTLITENTVSRTLYSAIYLQHTDQTIVHDNHLEDFGLIAPKHEHNGGVYAAAAVTQASIHDNIVIEPLSHGSQYGIKVADLPENIGNAVSQNMLSGEFLAGASISAPLKAIMPDNTML